MYFQQTGLKSKVIAESGKKLHFTNKKFLTRPDGAACFHNKKGWAYVINSEEYDKKGGVGAIYFDSNGQMVDYKLILKNTSRNCGGGKTSWNTWISCEEIKKGQCYEVDPYGVHAPTKTVLGTSGGRFESVAYDDDLNFYVTEDHKTGALRRYAPAKKTLLDAKKTKDYWKILTTKGGNMDV